jgi:DedD protein
MLCLALTLLAGCGEEEPAPLPPAAQPAPVQTAPKSNEPPPFTAADSTPQAKIEAGTAAAPKFTPPTAPAVKEPSQEAPAKTAGKAPPKPVASTPSNSTVVPSAQGEWVLQVGIHKTEDAASAMASKLKAKGFPAYTLNVATGGTGLSGSYYRVRIGAFATRDDALRYGENVLKPSGLKDFWADKKSNEARAREAQLPTP